MRSLLVLHSALLLMMSVSPAPSYDQSLRLGSDSEWAASQQRYAPVHAIVGKDETRPEPSKEMMRDGDDGSARGIKRFTGPTLQLRGTAEEIGLDSRTLATALHMKFLQDFAFLQGDFAFDQTYETWEIGLFDCEAWTVGLTYPIAFHLQCAGGSMDEPRHWHYATLGYGPKEKIVQSVRKALDSIVAEYASFVRKAHGKTES
ncbi:MAG: exported protein of unknown function [Nitrospira sp.]|jgi:hypothetical protein|nr:exported protein of unknown function [Nitrospira sp.]